MTLGCNERSNMSRPRIAICFFGITRSLKHTIDSIERNVLNPARRSGTVTVLSHFFQQDRIDNPRSGESGALDTEEYRLLPNDWIELEPPETCLERWDFEGLKAHGDYWNDDFRSLRNLVHQQHSLHRVTCAALETDPDLVLFCRPDLHYHDSFEGQITQALKDRLPTVRLPDWEAWRGRNDRFAIARGTRAIRAYGQRIEVAKKFCLWCEEPLHAERLLAYALRRRLVRVKTFPLRASRTRTNGTVVEESFIPPSWRETMPYAIRRRARFIALKTGTLRWVPRALRRGGE